MRNRCTPLAVLGIGMLCFGLSVTPKACHAQTQTQMDEKALADFRQADQALNVEFKHVAKAVPSVTRKKLVSAEKAWLGYRDSEAEFRASCLAEGGSLYTTVFLDAQTTLTRQRIADLKKAMSDYKL